MVSLGQTDRSANSLAKEYNVSVSTVSKWINQADPMNTQVLSLRERELIKEVKCLKKEYQLFKALFEQNLSFTVFLFKEYQTMNKTEN